jgi:peptide/nickel transport system substrate-binding protein
MSSQDNSKNTIRVLIDRYPLFDCTHECQAVDVTAQKIAPLIQESHYQLTEFKDDDRLILTHEGKPSIEFKSIRDEVTRALLFLRGDADVLYDTLSLAKTEWVRKQKNNIHVYEAPGYTLSYLGFQGHHPILNKKLVREAIASSLPVDQWIQYKFFNWVARDTEVQTPAYDLARANALLDQAGYPLREGSRFSLRYFTTPVREGNEAAQMVREALKQVGIEVHLITLETSLFYDKIQKGDFELFSSRWFRFSATDPVLEVLGSNQKRNYVHYSNPELDQVFAKNPKATLTDIRQVIQDNLPIVPLYTWKHGLVAGPRIQAPADISNRLDETFRFLTRLELTPELK